MSDEDRERGVEDLVRAAGPPLDVPPQLEAVARRAALGAGAGRPAARSRFALTRAAPRMLLAGAALVLAGTAALAVVIAIALRGPSHVVTIPLSGAGPSRSASGSVEIGEPQGAVRRVVLTVKNLPPAPEGHFYQMWIVDGPSRISAVSFDTSGRDRARVETVMPADMGWTECWVTMEGFSDRRSVPVLRS
jgi:hypothetical protein